MNDCSILFCQSQDLKVSPSPDADEIRRACAAAAIIKAASYGSPFSIRDVWRELGLGGNSSDAISARKNTYSRYYLRAIMDEVGVKTTSQIKNETAGGRRYIIPGVTIRGCGA